MPVFDTPSIIRDIVLVLDGGVIFYTLLFVAIFLGQWLRSSLRKFTDVRLAWAIFMLGMSLNTFSFIMSDFYFTEAIESLIWVKTGYTSMMIALIGFFIALERILPFQTRNIFAFLGLVITSITVLSPREWMTALALAACLLAFAVLSLFFIFYIRTTAGEVRSSIRLILIGFLIGFVGYLGRSDFIYYSLGEIAYVFGALFLVTGLLMLGVAVFVSPALDELDWPEQMLELYVIHKGGVLIHHHEFVRTVDMDRHLTAAGIAGIQSLLEEITQSIGLNNLSIGDVNILFAHGSHFTTVLISKRAYRVLLAKVEDFVEKFQMVFGREIENPANVSIFGETDLIVESIFSTEQF